MATLNVLIENINAGSSGEFYALKAEDVAIQVARTPLQIPVPMASPFIFDIGSYRPSLTISGVLDDLDTSDSTTFDGSGTSRTYYVPTQYQLASAATDWVHRVASQSVYILHSNYTDSTKYFDAYECAIQQFRCQLQAGVETKWEYTLQFVTTRRNTSLGIGATNT
tara:strand:- start:1443 stop:1940 length:498 start_codon:yes stop_codon:yes gene_type:complete